MVSVIITTYNRRDFLKDAVISVLNQDYREKEIIVVDDGSTDNSFDIIRDMPVRYIWKPNKGISSARNAGIAASKGDFIAFLDVDDIWLKGKLSLQMKKMEETGYLISYTDEIWIRGGRRVNQKVRHRKYSGYIFDRCLPLCIISPSSVLINREIFDYTGYFDESMPVCEDYDMWLRVSSRYPVLFIDKPLIVKTGGHEDQLSKKYEAMDRYRIQSICKILDNYPLSSDMRTKAVEELKRKCHIMIKGAEKRDRTGDADFFYDLINRYTNP